MSCATDLRTFLIDMASPQITQCEQGHIDERTILQNGVVWFGRSSTSNNKTMAQASQIADEQFFDIEIYHPDPDVIETIADRLAALDCYRGAMGTGQVQGFYVETQSDDYLPRVQFTDSVALESAFISIEVRSYTGP